jgi:hypothetical protein
MIMMVEERQFSHGEMFRISKNILGLVLRSRCKDNIQSDLHGIG